MVDRLRKLADALPLVESSEFSFGRWAGGERQPDGSISMPYFDFSPEALELLRAMPSEAFDWPAWLQSDEGQAFRRHPKLIAEASAAQLVRLSTALLRSDRFTEGSLAEAWASGLLLGLVRRAAALVEQEAGQPVEI